MKTNERQQSLWNSCLLGEIGNKEKRKKEKRCFENELRAQTIGKGGSQGVWGGGKETNADGGRN